MSYLILLNILQSSGKEWFEGLHVLQEVLTQYYSKNTSLTVNTQQQPALPLNICTKQKSHFTYDECMKCLHTREQARQWQSTVLICVTCKYFNMLPQHTSSHIFTTILTSVSSHMTFVFSNFH